MSALSWGQIAQHLFIQFTPVWCVLVPLLLMSIALRARLGFYGRLFYNHLSIIGFTIVLFWILTAVFAAGGFIITFNPLEQISGMKNAPPGTAVANNPEHYYLLGGDNLARDVFSRMVAGSFEILKIGPLATTFAFIIGIFLGLPAGYFGRAYDTILNFIANLILAFPVILLFYMLITPQIIEARIPNYIATVLFIFPVLFFVILANARLFTHPHVRNGVVALILLVGGYIYLGLTWSLDPFGLVSMSPNQLNIFVSIAFVNAPVVFRIVRGLTFDIKTRDYVIAAQTRGDSAWYIMLWEILPNVRGPLIVDFCLRIGYTTILLGTLGFFGLGVTPESPDWGSTINDGRRLLSIYPHPVLPPVLALMSLVLGLNLMADGLREELLRT